MSGFVHEGQRIAYEVHGAGTRTTILLPGLLISQRMQFRLARALARRGNRVVTMDPLGHGESDRPEDMWRYSMTAFGQQILALMDHLGIEEAVVGGTSLGANATLELAAVAPERLRGMILEMPVLDNGLLASALAFTPLLVALTFGAPLLRPIQRLLKAVPRNRLGLMTDVLLDCLSQDPGPSAALLQGIFFGRVAPHRTIRRTFRVPALVIGHPRDPIHPFSDADMVARELPNARLLDASSIFELRVRPRRLTEQIAAFVDECWAAPGAGQGTARGAPAATGARRSARAG